MQSRMRGHTNSSQRILQPLEMKVHIWHVMRKKGIIEERIYELENKISIGKNMCTWERG